MHRRFFTALEKDFDLLEANVPQDCTLRFAKKNTTTLEGAIDYVIEGPETKAKAMNQYVMINDIED